MTATTTRVCSLDEIEPGAARSFDVGRTRVCVVRIGDDVYAIGDRCSHQDYSLAEGEVDPDDKTLECWKHDSTFDLRTGEPTTLPATQPVPVYQVHVVGDQVVLAL